MCVHDNQVSAHVLLMHVPPEDILIEFIMNVVAYKNSDKTNPISADGSSIVSINFNSRSRSLIYSGLSIGSENWSQPVSRCIHA